MTTSPQPKKPVNKLLLVFLGGNLLAVGIVGWLFNSSHKFITNAFSFWQPKVTEPQVLNRELLLTQIKTLSELTTTVYQLETIVPTSADLVWGQDWTIATTKLLYLARGEVAAGIDLEQITAQDIQVNSDRITLTLPPATIIDSKIDVNNSQVYHYDRGWLNLGPDVAPQLQTLAQQKTLTKIKQRACEQDILTTANAKAQTTMQQFLSLTTQKIVEVKVNPEIKC